MVTAKKTKKKMAAGGGAREGKNASTFDDLMRISSQMLNRCATSLPGEILAPLPPFSL